MKLVDAVHLCRFIEAFCPEYGCHIGLTGGCLYKDGERKDVDILFYRIRQIQQIDRDGLTGALKRFGLEFIGRYGWMQKMRWQETVVDIFFPETPQSEIDAYERQQENHAVPTMAIEEDTTP
jgi:hypothetical protein